MDVHDRNTEDTAPHGPVILSPPDGTTIPVGNVTFSGTAEPSSHIVIRDWLVAVARCTADETGHWTAIVPDLPSGTHLLVAEWVGRDERLVASSLPWTIHVLRQVEWDAREGADSGGIRALLRGRQRADTAAGSLSEPVPERSEVEDHPDTPAPAPDGPVAPSIMHPESGSTVGCSLTLYGTSEAGSIVEVLDDMGPLVKVDSDDTGYWTAIVKDLTPGPHQLWVRYVGKGEDTAAISPPVAVVVREHISAADVDHP